MKHISPYRPRKIRLAPRLTLRQTKRLTSHFAQAIALAASLLFSAAGKPLLAQPTPAATISPAEYRTRLQSLDQLLTACQQASAHCKSDQVGPDVQVQLPTGARAVHFAWLRALLDQAAKPDAAQPEAAKPAPQPAPKSGAPPARKPIPPPDFPPPTVAQSLQNAHGRLAEELRQASQLASPPSSSPASMPGDTAPRRALDAILAQKEYKAAVVGPSIKDRILEKLANWINRFFAKIAQVGAKSKWIGLTAEILFISLLLGALIWLLIHLDRQGRYHPASLNTGPGLGAASARDWQLWLEDARRAASQGAWRDAIHLTYWASISRLESSGLWPADRARTPREYLALLAQESTHRPGLIALTRSLERTWYANRPAAESDFRHAEQLAADLGAARNSRSAVR